MARTLEDLRRLSGLSAERLAEADAEANLELAQMHLAELRKALHFTQQSIAANTGMAQGEVSRIERRTDAYVSTVRSYIEAMGGKLRLIAEFPDGEPIEISGFSDLSTESKVS